MGTESTDSTIASQTVAAIDIGSNAVRMSVAQVDPDGQIEILERFQQAARLGQDTFREGRLSSATVRAVSGILRDYCRVLDLYQVKDDCVRAVATSAVREARNTDSFLDRVSMTTGLDVEVIDTAEESRLTVSTVRHRLGKTYGVNREPTAIVEVGGGSTLVTILDKGELLTSQSLRLGSIRLQEMLTTSYDTPTRAAELLSQHVETAMDTAMHTLPLKRVKVFVAVGADARFAARQAGTETDADDLHILRLGQLTKLLTACRQCTPEQLARQYDLPFSDAETLTTALLVYRALLAAAGTRKMLVADVSMRDGLVLDLAGKATGQEFEPLSEGVIHSAVAIAQKYQVNLDHAHNVAGLCDELFDELTPEHRLTSRHRLLLMAAALLHEVGAFVSNRAHHKHSYYLISNSEIYGLTREELTIVALVARYHRRSIPKPTHVEYMALPRQTRMVVAKLAAILRVADGLDRGHSQQVTDVACTRQDDQFVITVSGLADATLERRAMAAKADLFEDIYGMKVRLEQA